MASERPATEVANELANLLGEAKDIPLFKAFVRVDPSDARRLAGTLLETAEPTSTLHLAAAKAREALVRAKQVPFTDQVRLRREDAASLEQELRTAAGLPAT